MVVATLNSASTRVRSMAGPKSLRRNTSRKFRKPVKIHWALTDWIWKKLIYTLIRIGIPTNRNINTVAGKMYR